MTVQAKDLKVGDFLTEAKSKITEIIRKPLKNGKDAFILVVELNGLTGTYYKKSDTKVNIK